MQSDNESLYHRALGDAFDDLAPVLSNFHDAPNGGTASGTLQITRGRGWLRQALAVLMRLPPPGEHMPIFLQVQTQDDAEVWTRRFGAEKPVSLITRQYLQNGLLMENAGPLRFGFRLTVENGDMQFGFVRGWLLGIPLPSGIAPRVYAQARGVEDGWRIQVRVEVPLLGMITQYEGTVKPQ